MIHIRFTYYTLHIFLDMQDKNIFANNFPFVENVVCELNNLISGLLYVRFNRLQLP